MRLQRVRRGVGGGVQVRLAGDRCVLVEYGPMELDLKLRVRIWALQAALADAKVPPPPPRGMACRVRMNQPCTWL